MSKIYDFEVETLAGEPTTLAAHQGKVMLILIRIYLPQ